MTVITILFALLVIYVAFEAIYTLSVINPRRRQTGQPTIGEIIDARRAELDITSHARMERYTIKAILERGGRAALDREIRKRFTTDYTDWSIDYCYPHYDYNGRRQSGKWSSASSVGDATIYFYKRRPPPSKPEPAPPPKPVEAWSDADERQRIEMFLAGPSAFWLNPDWEKARETGEPFWMHDPAPIPSRFQPPSDKIRRAAELIARDGVIQTLDHRTLTDRAGSYYVYVHTDDGDDLKMTSRDYRAAQRLALELVNS